MKTKLLLLSLFGLWLASAQTLTFQNLADMSLGRGAITSVITNDNIYVSNGYNDTGKNANYIEKYNIPDNRWSVINSKLVAKKYANSETYDNKIYIFNGAGNRKLEILDLSTNTITQGKANPFYAESSGSAVYNGKIYVFGGSGKNKVFSKKFQYYDIASNTWNALPDMPAAKETKGKIVNDKLYIIGGYNGTSSNLIDVYDLNTNRWTDQYTMPVSVSGHSLAVLNDKIFIIGDYNNQTFLAYFDTTTNELHQLSSNMIPRRHSTAEIYDNKLYIIGGNTTSITTSAIRSIQVADIGESLLSNKNATEDSSEKKIYANARNNGFIINNKNNSNQFEYTVFSIDGKQIAKGLAYYNNNIDVTKVSKGTYIFSYRDEKGILKKIRIIKQF